MALTKEQLEARKSRVGGSDAAAICGKDPYRTAYEIALRIRGEIEQEDISDRDQILFGNEMEGVLARIYEHKHKVKLETPDTIIHPKHPFLAVNIDRRITGNPKTAIECKNTGLSRATNVPVSEMWGKPGTDECPERVILQCAHAMMIDTAIESFHVLRCYGGNQYQQFVVPRNAQLIEALEQIEVAFMTDVLAGKLPEPDWFHRSTSDAVRRAFKKIEGTIEARPDLVHWTQVYDEAAASLKEAKALEEALKNRIVHMIGNTEVAVLPDGRKWRRQLKKNAGYTVEPFEYIETKLIKPRAKKGAKDDGNADAE